MATAEEYASWIVANADKKGTPEFNTVAQAYNLAKGGMVKPKAPIETPAFEKEAAATIANPDNAAVAFNSAMKGVAGIPDAILNTPNNLLNLGKAAVGTAATAAGRPDLAPDVSPNPDLIKRGLTAVGAIDPVADPKGAGQRVMDSAIQGGVSMAMLPSNSLRDILSKTLYGATSSGAGQATTEATGSPLAGMAVSMATPLALNAANVAAVRRLDTLAGRQSLNQERDATLRAAREAGYVYPPSQVRETGMVNNALESLAGKAALGQEATRRNVEVTQKLMARELGLPENTAITETVLRDFRNKVSQPYRELEAISPITKTIFERLKDVRNQAQLAWKEYGASAKRSAMNDAQRFDGQAARLENQLEGIANNTGNPALMDRVREARTQLAKSYEIERAWNSADATIAARELGTVLDKGKKLTGNLETVARAGLARDTRPYMGEGATTPGISALAPVSAGMGAAASMASGNVGPALMGVGIPLLRGPARSLLLSDLYQNAMQPSYTGGLLTRKLANISQPRPAEIGLAGLLSSLRQE